MIICHILFYMIYIHKQKHQRITILFKARKTQVSSGFCKALVATVCQRKRIVVGEALAARRGS